MEARVTLSATRCDDFFSLISFLDSASKNGFIDIPVFTKRGFFLNLSYEKQGLREFFLIKFLKEISWSSRFLLQNHFITLNARTILKKHKKKL